MCGNSTVALGTAANCALAANAVCRRSLLKHQLDKSSATSSSGIQADVAFEPKSNSVIYRNTKASQTVKLKVHCSLGRPAIVRRCSIFIAYLIFYFFFAKRQLISEKV